MGWIVNKACIDMLDTTLYIFEKLISFVISENEQIDAWIATFSSNTMHALQQNIHNAINAMFFYLTELKQAVFEKKNDDSLKEQNDEKNKNKTEMKMEQVQNQFDALTMSDILSKNCLQLLDRILYGITSYICYDLQTFTDHFVGILEFVFVEFEERFFCILCNVISKMLTNEIADNEEENKKYKAMIVEQLYANDYLFDIVIGKILKNLALKLTSGHQHELLQLFETGNQFLSVSLLIYDVFVHKNKKFISRLLNEEKRDLAHFESLICIICQIGITKQRQEIVLPLLVVVMRTINMTSDKKLKKFVKHDGMKKHIQNLIKIASDCQQFEHVWLDDICMNLVQ